MKRFKIKIVGLLFCVTSLLAAGQEPLPNGTDSPDPIILYDSWHLWLDEKVAWRHDKLYLPDEVDLTKLSANAPTGGWDMLDQTSGTPVVLPATVEEYYWGKRPCMTTRMVFSPLRPNESSKTHSIY
ncbi:MAG: beta-glycosidase [Pedosphaera sp.]|nr:beta-glycosidase [Pedosphaera sp.]